MTTSLSRSEIQEAIKCELWQEFRLRLKGFSTKDKVDRLQRYLDGTLHDLHARVECCLKHTRHIQVLNYLHALSRGGLLEPLTPNEINDLLLRDMITVRIRR